MDGPSWSGGGAGPGAAPPGRPGKPGGSPSPNRWRGRVLLGAGVVLVALVAGLAGAGVTGRGPLGGVLAIGSGDDASSSAAPPPPPRQFSPGQCVNWDAASPDRTPTTVVPCDQPHLLEITAAVDVPTADDRYPTPADWATLVGEHCTRPAADHFGARLDPEGKFAPGGLWPVEASWAAGERKLWCGIEAARPGNVQDAGVFGLTENAMLTGSVVGQAQHWAYKAGDCLRTSSHEPVPCTEAHEVEVVGEVILKDRKTVPAVGDREGWRDLLGDDCDSKARAHLGRAPRAPWEVGWLAITADSWEAGKRNVTCVVGRSTPTGWETVSTSAKNAR